MPLFRSVPEYHETLWRILDYLEAAGPASTADITRLLFGERSRNGGRIAYILLCEMLDPLGIVGRVVIRSETRRVVSPDCAVCRYLADNRFVSRATLWFIPHLTDLCGFHTRHAGLPED